MEILKINYDNELFSDFDYVECDDSIIVNTGYKIIVDNDKLRRLATVLEVDNSFSSTNLNKVVRVATKRDLEQNRKNIAESTEALVFAQERAKALDLDMHFISSFYTFDRKQLFLSYVSDNRVDFRELARILAQKYKTRIELRQIGVRDRAKKVGGLGPCGLFLCCSKFLTEFVSVSINMAKNQFLALNPTKINGVCGRLLCCLNYENDVYTELKQGLPSIGNLVETEDGLGKVVEVDVFKKIYKVEIKNKGILEFSVDG